MNKHFGKLLGLLILTLLVTGCTVFVSVDRRASIEGWVYEAQSDIIILSTDRVPEGYRPVRNLDIVVTSSDGTYHGTATTNRNGYFKLINLSPGQRRITLYDGNPRVSFPTYIYRGLNRLVYPATSVGHYIFVGIDEYQTNRIPNLKVSVNDARDMKRALVDDNAMLGTDTVTVLTDKQATKTNIRNAILNAAERASYQDYLVFYFSGYSDAEIYEGGWVPPLDHLIPYDGIVGGTEGTIRRSIITDGELADWLGEFPNKNITVILDVSYAATFFDGTPRTQSLPEVMPEIGLQALKGPGYTVLGATATSDEERNIVYKGGNSVFTSFLLQGLGRGLPADSNNNGRVTAQELFDYASYQMELERRKWEHDDKFYVPTPKISGTNTNTVIYRVR